MNATVSSVGLNTYEEGLIQGHLKVLNTKTRDVWRYIGIGTDADLVIVKKSNVISDGSKVAVLAEDGFRKAGENLYYLGETLRIFSFLELLLDIENNSSAMMSLPELINTNSNASTIYEFCNTSPVTETFDIKLNGESVCQALFEQDQWKTVSSLVKSDLISRLASGNIQFEQAAASIHQNGSTTLSIRELLWELGNCDFSSPLPSSNVYRISSWPLLGAWYTAPYMSRLSALYGKRFASIEEGVRFSGATPEQVQAFLIACELCNLGLQKRTAEKSSSDHQAQTSTPSTTSVTKGLLYGLRKKLGMTFSK